ncbi:YagK/YfjJ domain-containing protein [Vibrio atlanticus]|uniref:YagK/YfjJ domain-containing protein n=1 Tax=Vibrio atlanticus TaxID=693153 RepID=UPI003552A5F6
MYYTPYQGNYYLGLPINPNYPMNESYLAATHKVLLNSLNQHPRTLVFHVVLRYPVNWSASSENSISKFIKAYKQKVAADLVRRQRSGKRVHSTEVRYVWCRESNYSIKEHYHVFFLMNADTYWQFGRFENFVPGELTWMLNGAWASAINISESDAVGLVHFCDGLRRVDAKRIAGSHTVEKDGVMRDSFESVFNWMSYLSKVSTKQYGRGGRNFGYSLN